MIKNALNKLTISLLVTWFVLTVFVDFFLIPSAFRQLADIFIAGELGITIFSKLNTFEIIFAVVLLGLSIFSYIKNPNNIKKINIIIFIFLTSIASIYFFYLTSKIAHLTEIWKNSIVISEAAIETVKSEHNFYHNLYIKIDTIKLVLLLFGIGISLNEKGEIS